MDPSEIIDYVFEGILWLSMGGLSYFGPLTCLNLAHGLGQRIRSQKELESVVNEEATKLGLDPSKIDVKYNSEDSAAWKNGERYNLSLRRGWSSTRATVRHELYHILKDCDKGKPNFFNYWFLGEPRALIYGALGIKL